MKLKVGKLQKTTLGLSSKLSHLIVDTVFVK